MELSESSLSVFYISKCLALAPISVHTNAKGAMEIRRSILFTIYSFTFGVAMVVIAYRDSFNNPSSKFPALLTSNILKLVVLLDLTAVAFTSGACIGCSLFSVKPSRELNLHLRKFDDVLHCCTNFKRNRLISGILATVPLMLGGTLIGIDIWIMTFQNEERGGKETNEKKYFAFYALYFIIFGFQVLYANTAWGLSRRFRHLNILLKCNYLPDNKLYGVKKTNKVIPNYFMSQQNNCEHLNAEPLFGKCNVRRQVDLLKKIAENYESLCNCVEIFSNTFGIAVLFILVSCMLHTVATSYFIFLALLDGNDILYICIQSLWILYHTLRLFLVVEPCHMASVEGKKTIQIVAKIGRKIHEPVLVEEVRKFWKQLLITNAEVTAMGLCSIDRHLLTSFSSSIATYLVILIQFQKVNN